MICNNRFKLVNILFITIFLFSCNEKSNNNSYENEDLLLSYISEYQEDRVLEKEYKFLTLKSKNTCKACYTISLDSVVSFVSKENKDLPLYILCDEKEYISILQARYHGKKMCFLYEKSNVMAQYGLDNVYPHLFHIKNNRLFDWEKIMR
jgi:hypothetical protein